MIQVLYNPNLLRHTTPNSLGRVTVISWAQWVIFMSSPYIVVKLLLSGATVIIQFYLVH